jgi:octaprenyl-diphosphate synthase
MEKERERVPSSLLSTAMRDCRVKVDSAILDELNQHKDSVFFTPLKRALKGGKRLRPILLVLSFESVDSGESENPFPAAVAVELAHLESLIHDDIIDRDLLRRERQSFHVSYGQEMALLSADFILSIVLDITARYNDPKLPRALALATARMSEGEFEEVKAFRDARTLSGDEYIDIISKKTASLFEASATIGAMVGKAREHEAKALSNYGRLLGVAYQIRDDIADMGKSKQNSIVSFLGEDIRSNCLDEMSKSKILEAKKNLKELRSSEAKNLLMELADFVVSPLASRV